MTAPAVPPRLAPASPADAVRVLSIGGMLAVAALSLSPIGGDANLAWLVLAVGLLVGLPHGAVDHLVPSWEAGEGVGRPSFVLVAGYVAIAAVAFTALQVAPLTVAAGFLVVSAWHFGTGDVVVHERDAGRLPVPRWVAAVAFGLPPIALPIAVHADTVAPVLTGLAPGLAVLTDDGVRATMLAVTILFVAVVAFVALTAGRTAMVVDLLVLLVTFVLTPPLLAFAVYFGLWHAARHVARLLELDPRNDAELARGLVLAPLGRFARSAAWPTLVSVVVLLGLWWGAGGAQGMVEAHLGLLVALTMPHVGLVAWLDRRPRPGRRDVARVPPRGARS